MSFIPPSKSSVAIAGGWDVKIAVSSATVSVVIHSEVGSSDV